MNRISLSLFRSALECAHEEKAIRGGYLGRDEKLSWLREVRKELPEILRTADFAKCDELVSRLPNSCAAACEFEAAKQRTLAQLERMVEYKVQNGIDILPGTAWATKVNDEVVTGIIDFVAVKPDGSRTAVMLDMLHKPESSKQAKKECNKLHFNLQLVLAANAHPIEGVTKYAVWHFDSKDDKNGQVVEFKEKGQIVEFDFGGSPEEYLQRAIELYAGGHAEKCSDCLYKSVCKGYSKVPDSDSDEDGAKPRGKIKLTASQRKVVDFRDGNLAVLAVPGSGKTNTLACRTAAMIHDGSARPEEVLFLTFTRKAAGELADRIAGMLPADSDQPEVNTLNGWCFNVLKENSRIIGKVRLAEDPVRKSLLLKAVNELSEKDGVRVKDINYSYMVGPHSALEYLDKYVETFVSIGKERFTEVYPKVDADGIEAVSKKLSDIMEKGGYIRFDDQLSRCYQLLTEHPAVLQEIAAQYRFVMVDEAQDLNDIQYKIVSLIADAGHGNLCMVGDDDQSIYDFRGGSNEFLLDFAKRTGTSNVFMEDSFRIIGPVAELANEVIGRNSHRIGKMIRPGRVGSNMPYLMQGADDEVIAEFVKKLAAKYGGKNVAVLARSNNRLTKLADVLSAKGVVAASPKDYLLDDCIVNMIHDMMCFIMDSNAKAFTRLFNHYTGGVEVNAKAGESYYEALVSNNLIIPVEGVDNRRKYMAGTDIEPSVRAFGMTVFRCRQTLESAVTAEDVLRGFFRIMFGDGTDNENEVLEFLSDKFHEAGVDTPKALKGHIDSLRIFGDTTRMPYNYPGDTVNLLTAHDSKGKEFDCVVILDADEFGCFSDKAGEAEEGRRILYVAITRAREALTMTTSGGAMEADLIAEIAPYCNIARKEGAGEGCREQKSGTETSRT